MGCPNPGFDINKLTLCGAILLLLGDIFTLLVAYQQYCNAVQNRLGSTQIQQGQGLSQSNLEIGQPL